MALATDRCPKCGDRVRLRLSIASLSAYCGCGWAEKTPEERRQEARAFAEQTRRVRQRLALTPQEPRHD